MKLDITTTEQSSQSLPVSVHTSFDTLRENSLQASTVVSDNGTVVHSPQKRKVSKPRIVVAEATAKRRRQDRTLFSNELNESFLQNVFQSARCNGIYALKYTGDRQVRQHEITQPVGRQPNTQLSSLPPSPVVSGSTTSDDAAVSERGLHQEVIMHNYHEFADRRLFKDAGLMISPVSDTERRAYESIFMEDSDEWSPSAEE